MLLLLILMVSFHGEVDIVGKIGLEIVAQHRGIASRETEIDKFHITCQVIHHLERLIAALLYYPTLLLERCLCDRGSEACEFNLAPEWSKVSALRLGINSKCQHCV